MPRGYQSLTLRGNALALYGTQVVWVLTIDDAVATIQRTKSRCNNKAMAKVVLRGQPFKVSTSELVAI